MNWKVRERFQPKAGLHTIQQGGLLQCLDSPCLFGHALDILRHTSLRI